MLCAIGYLSLERSKFRYYIRQKPTPIVLEFKM